MNKNEKIFLVVMIYSLLAFSNTEGIQSFVWGIVFIFSGCKFVTWEKKYE